MTSCIGTRSELKLRFEPTLAPHSAWPVCLCVCAYCGVRIRGKQTCQLAFRDAPRFISFFLFLRKIWVKFCVLFELYRFKNAFECHFRPDKEIVHCTRQTFHVRYFVIMSSCSTLARCFRLHLIFMRFLTLYKQTITTWFQIISL